MNQKKSRRLKRVCAILLTLVMLIEIMPFEVFATEKRQSESEVEIQDSMAGYMMTEDMSQSGNVNQTEETQPGSGEDTEEAQPGSGEDTEEIEPGSGEDTEETQPGSGEDTEEIEPGSGEDTEEAQPGSGEDTEEAQPGSEEDTKETQPEKERQPGTEEMIRIDESPVDVNPETEETVTYEVKAEAPEYASIVLTDDSNQENNVTISAGSEGSLSVADGNSVTVKVTAQDGYKVASITSILNEGTGSEVTDKLEASAPSGSMEKSGIVVTGTVRITVELQRFYKLTVGYDGTAGKVSYGIDESSAEPTDSNIIVGGGVIEIAEGQKNVIKISPFPSHEITQVKRIIGNGASEVLPINVTSEGVFTDTVEDVRQDYSYEVEFKIKTYEVTAIGAEHGTVSIGGADKADVEHGGSVDVTLTPTDGYVVKTVSVSDTEGNTEEPEFQYGNDDVVSFRLDDIQENKEIAVTFEQRGNIEYTDAGIMFNKDEAVRTDETKGLYVFGKESDGSEKIVKFEVVNPVLEVKGLRIQGQGSGSQLSVEFSSDTKVESILLLGKKAEDSLYRWYKVNMPSEGIEIVFDKEKPEVKLELPPLAGMQEVYNKNVDVVINVLEKVNESESYSGIKKISYMIIRDSGLSGEAITKEEEITDYENVSVDGKTGIKAQIMIDANENKSGAVKLKVRVEDNAGNVEEKEQELKINPDPLELKISIDNIERHPEAVEGYYNDIAGRKVTIQTNDCSYTVDKEAIKNAIEITATDAAGQEIENVKPELKWIEETDGNYVAELHFIEDANYKWQFGEYVNKAGTTASVSEEGTFIYDFTLDKAEPHGILVADEQDVTAGYSSAGNVLSNLSKLALFRNKSVKVIVEKETDTISGIAKIRYYKQEYSENEQTLSRQDLEDLFRNNPSAFVEEPYVIDKDSHFVVYARITDKAGNTNYIGTNGLIVDLIPGLITVEVPSPNVHGYYSDDVIIKATVREELAENGVFSGIERISYTITCDGKMTQEGDLYNFQEDLQGELAQKDALRSELPGEVKVDAKKNNSDNVKVVIRAMDNAGNEFSLNQLEGGNSTAIEEISLKINATPPEMVVDFGEDIPNRIEGDRGYYRNTLKSNATRVAMVTIKDRATTFDETLATQAIFDCISAVDDGKEVLLNAEDMMGAWTHNGEIHTVAVNFIQDGNYTCAWDKIVYANKANVGLNIQEKKGETPGAFTIDNNSPSGMLQIEEKSWTESLKEFVKELVFNFSNDAKGLEVKAEGNDRTSPVELFYYKTDKTVPLKAAELDQVSFEEFPKGVESLWIMPDERCVIYLKVLDYAGNYIYISSEGYVVEDEACEVTLTPSKPDKENNNQDVYGYYNGSSKVMVNINVEDAQPYSGIKYVAYRIVRNDGTEIQTAAGELYRMENKNPSYEEIESSWNGDIEVSLTHNNSSNVTVFVTVEDNAGNITEKQIKLDIDTTNPMVQISYDNNEDNSKNSEGEGYFNADRTATIVITERENHFNAQKATESVSITAVDANGNTVSIDAADMISSWKTEKGEMPDDDRHIATISYTKDATYTFSINYSDEAGNSNTDNEIPIDTGKSVAPLKFTIDKVGPMGELSAVTSEGVNERWNELANSLTFGIWSAGGITVDAVYKDATSPMVYASYYKDNGDKPLSVAELDKIKNWKKFEPVKVSPNEQFTVYLRMEDLAGNVSYISTDGLIADNTLPVIGKLIAEGESASSVAEGDIYSGDVNVTVSVEDPIAGNTYAGIKEVSYSIFNMGNETESGILYSFNKEKPSRSELMQDWEGVITVSSETNNSNEVIVEVYAEDNAGNLTTQELELKIDVTPPEILISYDNNNPDSEIYYKETRIATISVSERNFDPELVLVDITNSEGTIPTLGSWSEAGGAGNGDDTVHTATINYDADGDYTFDIECTDMATNEAEEINFAAGTVNEREFTIDQTLPEIAVSYDNNEVYNERYFNAPRVATVSITEHNFEADRVEFTQTASLSGGNVAVPSVSWSSSGDVHTATIPYDADGDYTFEVTMQDMAGNESEEVDYGGSVAGTEFTVDTDISELEITGVENGKAYKGAVVPGVQFSDINFGDYEIKLTRTRRDEINKDVTEQFIHGVTVTGNGGYGTFDTFEKIPENDGIYTLYAKMTDLAGNEIEETVIFTVNRFGSVYAYSDYLGTLIQDGGAYVKEVTEDLVITEYNADRLLAGSLRIEITLDGKPIEEVNYSISPEMNEHVSVGSSGWYQYRYEIGKENFAEDGVYKMSVSSKDATGNTPENTNYEKHDIIFRVDSTPPELTSVVGLEESIIDATHVDVLYETYDTIGLKSVQIYVNGKPYGEAITEFEDPNNYAGTFTLNESSEQQKIRLLIEDMAGNVTDTDAGSFSSAYAFQRTVTISTNAFVRLLANRKMMWIIFGSATVAGGVCVTGVVMVRRKKVAGNNK